MTGERIARATGIALALMISFTFSTAVPAGPTPADDVAGFERAEPGSWLADPVLISAIGIGLLAVIVLAVAVARRDGGPGSPAATST